MTSLLNQAFQKASQLPDRLQDELAQEFLAEIESEGRWDQALADSQDQLDRMAEKALEEYRTGKTREMGFDEI
jgi:hypothetical protein